MKSKAKAIPPVIHSDPTSRIRDLQSEKTRRRSELMESVRCVLAVLERDHLLSVALDELLEDLAERRSPTAPHSSENRGEGNAIVVVGASGAGKSTSIRRLIRAHPLTNGDLNMPGSLIFSVSAPSPCNLAELGREILIALGYPLMRGRLPAPLVWRMVRERIRMLGILVLHLDEMQHVIQTVNGPELQKVRNNLKGMLVDPHNPIALIVSGTPLVLPLMELDRQVARRAGAWIEFESLSTATHGKMVGSFVRQLAERATLQINADEVRRLVPRLIHAGCYQLGVIAEAIHDAIREALRADSNLLELNHFASSYAKRSRSDPGLNPYLAERWRDIDTTHVLARNERPGPVARPKTARKGEAR
ncbi:ATP-binding protein [Bosea sp. TAF32]|uniref:ATP-binding protein n=1 Tax=Bosea sp. TAF32 TaxID=3237482 RepID=UPI003F9144DE